MKITYGILRGGLGNQLFQLAAFSALAKRSGSRLVLDLNTYLHPSQRANKRFPTAVPLNLVDITKVCQSEWMLKSRAAVAGQAALRTIFDLFPFVQGVCGIFASEKAGEKLKRIAERKQFLYLDSYFGDVYDEEDMVHEIECLVGSLSSLAQKGEGATRDQNLATTGIHLRIGDLLEVNPKKVAKLDYIRSGLEAVSWDPRTPVVLFSDSPEMALEILKPLRVDIEIADPQASDIETLLAIGSREKLVCSTSTFSWWAAKMVVNSGGTVAFPKPRQGDMFREREVPGWNWI